MHLSFRKITRLRKRLLARLTGRINVHFLHIRKTGGTALKHALGDHQVTPNCVLYLHPHRIRMLDVPTRHRAMFVTRDPVSRYVSGFGSGLRQGAPSRHVAWSKDEALAFSRFSDPNSLALALNPAHPKHAEALHAMQSIPHIRSSYWDWFGDEEALAAREDAIFFIGRIESFEADFEALKGQLGLPPELTLPLDPRASNRGASQSTPPVLEPMAIELLKSWYRRDYDFLAYCERWRERHGGPVAALF